MKAISVAIATALAVSVCLLPVGCSPETNPRYFGWRSYSDRDDGYSALVPPEWEAADELMPGMRGTRFNPVYEHDTPLAGLVYFTVYVRDLEEGVGLEEGAHEAAARELAEGIWLDLEIEGEETSIDGTPARRYQLEGGCSWSGVELRGFAVVLEHLGKQYVFFASATEETYPRLADTFEMILASIQLP